MTTGREPLAPCECGLFNGGICWEWWLSGGEVGERGAAAADRYSYDVSQYPAFWGKVRP